MATPLRPTPTPPGGPLLTPPGGPPSGIDVEHRLTALETRLDAALPTLASKSDIEGLRADVHKVDASIARWMLATILVVIGTLIVFGFGVMNFVRPPAQTQPATNQPIVIQMPPGPAPSAPQPQSPGKAP